jgi:thiol-disulfide isomerase/thioredoxin
VVNFFASWCPDCQAELAAFAALAARTAGHVDVIGVDSNDHEGAAAQTLLSKAQATYPVGLDPDAKVAGSYLLNALPVTYFLDGGGHVVHVAFGTQTPASLARWTDALTRTSAGAGTPS